MNAKLELKNVVSLSTNIWIVFKYNLEIPFHQNIFTNLPQCNVFQPEGIF